MQHRYERIDLLGCPFDVISYDETVEQLRLALIRGERLQLVPANVDFVMKAWRDPVFAAELRRADLVVADGVVTVWAASLLGTPLRGRVSGTELVWSCAQLSQQLRCAVGLVGGMPGVAERAAKAMRQEFPRARLHAVPTPHPLDGEASQQVVEHLRSIDAGIVLVALGAPRQERWIQAHLPKCGAGVGIGIGSAFDIISGDRPRAPRLLRDHGLEWFHRMVLEPRRLARRYLVEDSPFLLYLAAEVARRRVGLRREGEGT
jgi:N-acetylglucosaminyldiphosphoundecaprenol N-acetyl-beta-D-mannosaminyltransferase